MIDNNWPESGYYVMCDFCSNDTEVDTESWAVLVSTIQRAGWVNFKKDNEWKNKCPACAHTYRENLGVS